MISVESEVYRVFLEFLIVFVFFCVIKISTVRRLVAMNLWFYAISISFFFRIRFHFIGIFKEESSQDVLDVQIFLFEILGGKKFIDCTYEKFYDVSWQLA